MKKLLADLRCSVDSDVGCVGRVERRHHRRRHHRDRPRAHPHPVDRHAGDLPLPLRERARAGPPGQGAAARAARQRSDVRIERDGHDRYRRTLANVFVGDVNVGETLIREGHALALPRRRRGEAANDCSVWCGPDATLEGGSRWTGNAGSADKYRPRRHPATGEWPTKCKWMITPTWGPSWCGNPHLLKG